MRGNPSLKVNRNMKVVLLIVVLVVVSCTREVPIYYEYNGIVVTRIDKGNKVYFYHGKYSTENLPESSYVKAEYSGFNSGMGAYIVFNPNKKVEIIRLYDSFESVGVYSFFSLIEYDNIEFIDWEDGIQGNYNNIIYVSDIVETEIERNKQNNSLVKGIYTQ